MRTVHEIVTDMQETQTEFERVAPRLAAEVNRIDDEALRRAVRQYARTMRRIIDLSAELIDSLRTRP